MPTLKERELIKHNKQLTAIERRQEAVETVMREAKSAHRKILAKILDEEAEKAARHKNMILNLETDLKWEEAVLRPLSLYIADLGQKWSSSECSKSAVSHLGNLRKFIEQALDLYTNDKGYETLGKALTKLIENEPLELTPEEASPFYPYLDEREYASGALWDTLLKELNSPKNQKRYENGIFDFAGYIQMYHEIAEASAAPLNGSLSLMDKAMDADCIDRKQLRPLKDLIYRCYDDDEGEYKEDKAKKRAWLQSQKLSNQTVKAPSSRPGLRL